MNENHFVRELRHSLNNSGHFIKQVGNMFTEPGVPDLIGCIDGRFYAIECKVIQRPPRKLKLKELFSQNQLIKLRLFDEAGGTSLGVIGLMYMRPKQAIVLFRKQVEAIEEIDQAGLERLMRMSMVITRRGQLLKANGHLWDIENILKLGKF